MKHLFRKDMPNKPGCIAASTDIGFTWKRTSLKPNHPVLSVCIDPKSHRGRRTLYAAVFGEGVCRSDDAGAAWVLKDKGLDEQKRCIKVLAHADGTVFAARTGPKKNSSEGTGLFKSTDRGETWIKISDPKWQWIRDFTVKADDSNRILVPTSRTGPIGLHRSTGGGKTWGPAECLAQKDSVGLAIPFVAVAGDAVHVIYASLQGGQGSVCYRRNPTGNKGPSKQLLGADNYPGLDGGTSFEKCCSAASISRSS